MIPCDWIGIVTTRNETLRTTFMTGRTKTSPGSFSETTLPKRNTTPFSYWWTTWRVKARKTITTTTMTSTITDKLIRTLLRNPHAFRELGCEQWVTAFHGYREGPAFASRIECSSSPNSFKVVRYGQLLNRSIVTIATSSRPGTREIWNQLMTQSHLV